MPEKLQLKFDPNQDYQIEAIRAVVDVFDGLPAQASAFALGDAVVPNLPPFETLAEDWLAANVMAVQDRHGLPTQMFLDVDEGLVLDGAGAESWRYPSFTIEMETGTGKTYVYLRTIRELHKHYGFRKFVVVVPSIAIYEGVIKNFQVTESHFRALYHNETVNLISYDSSRFSQLRAFATSTFVEILVMTRDSFNRKSNRIFRASEQLPGERLPFQYIQETRPILILDEPQNMESDRAREALRTLHPLCALRYSATHRTTPNLLYQLTPFEAFQRDLVKRIEVDAVIERENLNRPFLALRTISRSRGSLVATVHARANDDGRTRERDVTLRHGDDLFSRTKYDAHRQGYCVAEINARDTFVEFENGVRLGAEDVFGPSKRDVFRVQIDETVEKHMQVQADLLGRGLKVLSLFFIDRVANYVEDDGLIKQLFDEAFERHKERFPHFAQFRADEVREGYFARRRVRGSDEEQAVDTTSRTVAERAAEKAAFELIMRDKERLLSLDEPVSFVFAHSALKEGWDNPNVFQICTLNQTVSEMKKRQEIGRGLRLPVDQFGNRIWDEDVNILTVVANESYQSYVSTLQEEYREDGQMAPPAPSRAGAAVATRNDQVFDSPHFQAFWETLSCSTRYRIHIDTPELVHACIERLNNVRFPQPVIVVERGRFVVTRFRLALVDVHGEHARIRLEIEDTEGNVTQTQRTYERRDDLSKVHKDDRLRGFRVDAIIDAGDASRVTFDNGEELRLQGSHLEFSSEAGQAPHERAELSPEQTYPVPNLLDRAARETGLTRPTVNAIFSGMLDRRKELVFRNPEGFAGVFITEIRNALADHLVERIEFIVTDESADLDLDDLFPAQKRFPQRELISAGETGLYDQVQIDSGVETNFVNDRLKRDERVLCFFKFPPSFKVPFPKIIGNYNPDWGILRRSDQDEIVLQLVRETKGTVEEAKLQFAHERRKVDTARKHFDTIGVDYRVVTDETLDWWRSADELPAQWTLSEWGFSDDKGS